MPAPTDAERMQLLGGMLKDAAGAKMARRSRLDAMEANAAGGATPPMAAASAPPLGAMSQSQFGGPPQSAEQRAAAAAKLAQMLRNRTPVPAQ